MRARYRLAKDMKPTNQLPFMDDLKLDGASEDQLDSLIQVVRIFSQDIKMSFGQDKCAILEMRRGRKVSSSRIDLTDDQHIGGNRGRGLQISWYFTDRPDSQQQDERYNNIGVC